MLRRRFLEDAGVAITGAKLGSSGFVRGTDARPPPGLARHHTYDGIDVAAIAPSHGGGHVVVNHGQGYLPNQPLPPLRVALLGRNGGIVRRRELDAPEDARGARADVVRTADGYAVAVGTWFATLREDLTVRTSGYAPDLFSGQNTEVAATESGVVVANDGIGLEDHRRTTVVGFGADGAPEWTWEYLEEQQGESVDTIVEFLHPDPAGGLVVGGYRLGTGHPWLARLAADGTEYWKATLTDAVTDAHDAVVDADGVTVVGHGGLLRLNRDLSVAWQRTYDAFEEPGGVLARTVDGRERTDGSRASSDGPSDGGYVFPASHDRDRVFGLARTDADGHLRWHRTYAHPVESPGDPDAIYTDVVERAPGEYLLVGYRENTPDGWAMLFSESVEPGPTPTAEPTPTETATPEPTPSSTPTDGSSGPIPGFDARTAVAGLAGLAAAWLARRG